MMSKILIIGKIPPPIGGVTIHTSRLLDYLNRERIEYTFYNNLNFNLLTFVYSIWKANKAHIHIRNPFFLFVFTLLCRTLNTYSIITIHGNIYSYNKIMSFFESLAVRISNKVILLNNSSYEIALKLNSKAVLMSAFITPIIVERLKMDIINKINDAKLNSKMVFCTNAYSLTYDKNGNEIYGITELVDYFNDKDYIFLFISDPKGIYYDYFLEKKVKINKNIKFIVGSHPFIEVIKSTDCFIRNTTTDGDSISINEALYFDKKVIATNCVNRPKTVIIYGHKTDLTLADAIDVVLKSKCEPTKNKPKNAAVELVKLYSDSYEN
jgi:glycosyltransferase involved in cell wall biosynthesis